MNIDDYLNFLNVFCIDDEKIILFKSHNWNNSWDSLICLDCNINIFEFITKYHKLTCKEHIIKDIIK